MNISERVRGNQKLQWGAVILLCLIGGFACSGGGGGSSSSPSADLLPDSQDDVSAGFDTQNQDVLASGWNVIQNQNVSVLQPKNEKLRQGVCWNGRSQLREVNRQRLRNNANKSCGAIYYQRQLKLLLVGN